MLDLSVFETFFPEKRPFLETTGRSQYQFPDYSRRIGQRPNRFALLDGDELVSKPDSTTIIGAVSSREKDRAGPMAAWRR